MCKHQTNIFRKMTSAITIFALIFSIIGPLPTNITYAIGANFTSTETQANVVASGATTASKTDAITFGNIPNENDTVTIGGTVYTFKDATMGDPAIENEIHVGTTAAEATANLINGLNGTNCTQAGQALTYSEPCSGIVSDTNVLASSGSNSDKITLTAINPGVAGNVSVSTSNPGTITVITPLSGGADAVDAVAQVVDFTPTAPSANYIFRATINGNDFNYYTNSGSTVQDIVDGLQPIMSTGAVNCIENNVKVTCTATSSGTSFTHSATIIDKNTLVSTINSEYSDGVSRTSLILNGSNYTAGTWATYTGAMSTAMSVESDITATSVQISNAITGISTAKDGLSLSTFTNSYSITNNSTNDVNIDTAVYNGSVYATYDRDTNIYIKKDIGSEELVGSGANPAIAIGTGGIVNLTYIKSGNVIYNFKTSDWNNETIVSAGTQADIDMDSNGKAHIVYTNPSSDGDGYNELFYTENTAGSFSSNGAFCDGRFDGGARMGGYCYSPNIKMDSNGKYHLLYHSQSVYTGGGEHDPQSMVYNTDAGGGITTYSPDMNPAFSSAGTPQYMRNAITIDGGGNIIVAYSNSMDSNKLYYAYPNSVGNGGTWTENLLGTSLTSSSIDSYGSLIGVSFTNGAGAVGYSENSGNGFVGNTIIDSSSSYSSLVISGSNKYIYYIKNDGNDDEVKLKSTVAIYTVPGAISTASGFFVSLTGSIDLSGLDAGGTYTLMSGSTVVSNAPLTAVTSTGKISLNPSYFSNFGYYTLTLSGSKDASTVSNLDTKSFYIGPVDYGTLFPLIGNTLINSGIVNNLTGITNANVTNYNGLYFEKTGYGKVYFGTGLNLTNSGTQTFLQNLPSKLDMTDGYINFDPTNSDFANYGASLYMYFNTGSSFITSINNSSNFAVRSSTGLLIDGSGVLSNILGACGVGEPYCTLYFDTSHFTNFDLKPILTRVNISSNNAYSGSLAKPGDVISVAFSGSEALTGVTVTINGLAAAQVQGGGDSWVAISVPVSSGNSNGASSIIIDYTDNNGNAGDTVLNTNDSSSVIVDKTSPTASVIYSTTGAINGDVVATLTGASEPITITNNSGTGIYTFSSNGSFTYQYRDSAGNTGSTVATVNWINKVAPVITLNGSGTINLEFGSGSYSELGAIWSDITDGTGVVSDISGSVNTGSLGTYPIQYIYVNSLNNTGSTTRTINVVDSQIPTLHEVTTISGTTSDNTPSLTIWASEISTPSYSGSCQASTGQLSAGNNTITFDTLPDGTYNFCYITLTDSSNNHSIPMLVSTFIVDTTNPTGSVTSPLSNSYLKGTVTITANAFDTGGIARVEFWYASIGTKIGEDTTYPYSISWNTVGIDGGDGSHDVFIKVYDNVGNYYTSSFVPVTVDNVVPTVTKIGTGAFDYSLPLISANLYGTGIIFSEELSSTGKTAVETALMNGSDKTLTYSWGTGGTSNVLNLTYSGVSAPSFINDVEASVTDLASNSNEVLIIDSALDSTQAAPDGSGAITVSTGATQVVITNPIQPVIATIPSGVDNPTIDVSAFLIGGTGILPAITIDSDNANNANVAIPASTTVTSADTSWNGIIAAPTVTTVSIPSTGSETRTLSTAIEVGFSGAKLSFDKAVRILLPGQAGKRAGYIRTGISFTEIINTCGADNQVTGDALATDSECKIDSGSDLVIWTKHFTSFATFSSSTTSNNVSGGGGGAIKMDSCPNGDKSPSYYDGTCNAKIVVINQTNTNGTTTTNPTNEPVIITTVTKDVIANTVKKFSDIGYTFAKNDIAYLVSKGIVKGFGDNTFRPENGATRAEFLAMTMKAFNIGISDSTKTEFIDIPEYMSWAAKYANKAKELGIINGQMIDGKLVFRPSDNVTRAEAVAILLKVANISVTNTKITQFTDIPDYLAWVIKYINKAKELGIINGQIINGKLVFRPSDNVTRAETARMIVKTLDILKK